MKNKYEFCKSHQSWPQKALEVPNHEKKEDIQNQWINKDKGKPLQLTKQNSKQTYNYNTVINNTQALELPMTFWLPIGLYMWDTWNWSRSQNKFKVKIISRSIYFRWINFLHKKSRNLERLNHHAWWLTK